jgi:GNAT superfamily N-acetyltransferase
VGCRRVMRHTDAMSMGPEVLAAADRNMVVAWRDLVAVSPDPGVVDDGNLVLLSSGVPIALFNPAFITGAPSDPVAVVERCFDHYEPLGVPFALYFRDEVAPGLADACLARGLVEHWRPPLMVLDPIPPSTGPAGASLEIRRVDATNVGDYTETLSAGFGMPHELAERMLGRSLLKVKGFTGFLGVIGDEPVGTSGLCLSEAVAGVYNVATLPARRGRGIGAALTWAAAWAGRDLGATCSILQASEQGEPVYRRMGYQSPTRYRQFVPAGPESA